MPSISIMFSRLISLLLAVICLPISVLTYGIDLISVADRPDESRVNVVGVGAYFRSQGMTSNGDTLYFSSKTTLICTKDDARTLIAANYSAIPEELGENYGIKHIGGISYYNGYIYAGLEDSKVWDHPLIGVYDAETLEFVKFYETDSEVITRGMPWVCVDPETGLLYCMDHSKKPTKMLVYNVENDMSFVREIPLSECVPSIQGAEFLNGVLYAATNDDTQAIYKIYSDGTVEKYLDRNLTSGSEGEGMTFMNKDGKTVLLAMDMGPLFVNAFVREYAMDTKE